MTDTMPVYYRDALVDVINQHPRNSYTSCFRCGSIPGRYSEHIADMYEQLFALREVPVETAQI